MRSLLRLLASFGILITTAKAISENFVYIESSADDIFTDSDNKASESTSPEEENEEVITPTGSTILAGKRTINFEPIHATTVRNATENEPRNVSETTTAMSRVTSEEAVFSTEPINLATTTVSTPPMPSTTAEISSEEAVDDDILDTKSSYRATTSVFTAPPMFSTTAKQAVDATIFIKKLDNKTTPFFTTPSTSPSTAEITSEEAEDSTIFTTKSSYRLTPSVHTTRNRFLTTTESPEQTESVSDYIKQQESTTISRRVVLESSTTSSQPSTSSKDPICMDLLKTKINRSDCHYYKRLCRRRGLEDFMKRTCPVTCGYCKMCFDDMKTGLCTQASLGRMCNNRNPRIRVATRAKCPVACGICSPGTILVLR